MARVLIICGDRPAFPGWSGSGAGVRAYTLGQGLAAHGHELAWAAPKVSAPDGRAPEGVALFDRPELDRLIAESGAEVILFQHWSLIYGLKPINKPTAIDLHGPALLETLFQDSPDFKKLIVHKVHSLRQGDFFLCSGEYQRHYWYAWLLMAEHDVRRPIVAVVPPSLPPRRPDREPDEEVIIVYGGFYLPWQDPVWALEALLEELETRGTGRLRFFGGRHPFLKDLPLGAYADLEKKLGEHPQVDLPGVVPWDELLREYGRATAALDLMGRNPERELAFANRTVDYLQAGLPVIHQPWDEAGRLIGRRGAGWLVEPGDRAALSAAFETIWTDPAEVRRRSTAAGALAEELCWETTMTPLARFCDRPTMNRSAPELSVRTARRPVSAKAADLVGVLAERGPAGAWAELKKRLAAPRT